jgi:CTP:phosphocholine cytidylyltransferase-like protein/thiamine kinase-like enzyme
MFMNTQACDIMNVLLTEPYVNQRILAERCGHSLGTVNRCLKELIREDYLGEDLRPTGKARQEAARKAPKNAVILAAGPGIRMIPINTEIPKAFLEVAGEPLIERLIRQLHEAGIKEICVIVGYQKEQFEYLIDDFGVRLIVNPDYAVKNNLGSLRLAAPYLSDSYIVPCDIWCRENPFRPNELYSWYMISDRPDEASMVRVNRRGELICVSGAQKNPRSKDSDRENPPRQKGNAMAGIAYLQKDAAAALCRQMEILWKNPQNHGLFWEAALFTGNKMTVYARLVPASLTTEINTYEQLRSLDNTSPQLKSDKLDLIAGALHVSPDDIVDITVLKKGMTNRSFLFSCRTGVPLGLPASGTDGPCLSRYIMRIPGEGTDRLIDRSGEAAVCGLIRDKNICEDIVFMDPENGYKITRFIEGARTCDPSDRDEVARCLARLKEFHQMNLQSDRSFDLYERIEFYESLWKGRPSAYRNYAKTKADVLRLKPYTDIWAAGPCLTHIDAVPDNFLLFENERGEEEIRLIDWEYAAMQDPHVDLAMFCIYAMYGREQIDWLIGEYFSGKCPVPVRIKIYCYIAVCGLVWSNWCEYKRNLGVEFGEYSLRQYRYAREYYQIAREEMEKAGIPFPGDTDGFKKKGL